MKCFNIISFPVYNNRKTRASHNTEENQPSTDPKSKDMENSTSVHGKNLNLVCWYTVG